MNIRWMERMGLSLFVLKSALAAGVGWWAAHFVSNNAYPYFAPLAAVLTIQVTVVDTLENAWNRTIGVVGGVLVSFILSRWMSFGALSITLVVLVGMALSTALRLNSLITSQVAVSSLLVLAFGGSHPGYAYGRIVETAIGCLVAIVVNALVIPPNPIPGAETELETLCTVLGNRLRGIAAALSSQGNEVKDELEAARQIGAFLERAETAVHLAMQSARLSPFARKRRARLRQISAVYEHLERITNQVRGVARGLYDLKDAWTPSPGLRMALETTGTCVTTFGHWLILPSKATQDQLFIEVAVAQSQQSLWLNEIQGGDARLSQTTKILLAGVFTDLHRMVGEIRAELKDAAVEQVESESKSS